MVSTNNYIEGPNGDSDWFTWDDEMEQYMLQFLCDTDQFIYGRKAYESMIQYWPFASEFTDFPNRDIEFVNRMNDTLKLVLSNSLDQATWNASVIRGNIAKETIARKRLPGKNIAFFAGSEAASVFIQCRADRRIPDHRQSDVSRERKTAVAKPS